MNGKTLGGNPFSRGVLFHMLRNRTYLGMIVHRDKVYPGMHPAILDSDLFEAVQTRLDANARRHASSRDHVARAPLTGRIFDVDGQPMSPTFSHGRKGKLYRYYVSVPLLQGQRRPEDDSAIRRVPAGAFEARLAEILRRTVVSKSSNPLDLLTRVEIHTDSLQLLMPIHLLPALRSRLMEGEQVEKDPADASQLRLTVPVRMQLRGGQTVILGSAEPATRPDPVLIKALRAAHAMVAQDSSGLPVLDAAPVSPYRRRLVRLAFLTPDLQRAILAGRQPADLTLAQLIQSPVPLSWIEQARIFGVEAPR